MADQVQAKRFVISGSVQGVGYRYFAQRVADQLGVAGYVKNLHDGRVEVYAIGFAQQLADFRAQLEAGPGAASITSLLEEDVALLPRYADGFSVEFERW